MRSRAGGSSHAKPPHGPPRLPQHCPRERPTPRRPHGLASAPRWGTPCPSSRRPVAGLAGTDRCPHSQSLPGQAPAAPWGSRSSPATGFYLRGRMSISPRAQKQELCLSLSWKVWLCAELSCIWGRRAKATFSSMHTTCQEHRNSSSATTEGTKRAIAPQSTFKCHFTFCCARAPARLRQRGQNPVPAAGEKGGQHG